MKKLVNLFLSLCCCVAVFSQNLRDFSVISFKEDIYSSTATNRRYKLVDGNGETFSIIKLNAVTPDDDLSAYSLDFGCYEGRKKIVDGEVWWYVQCNAKHATISREGYKTLKYELDETVEPGTVYYMTFEVIDSGAVDLGLSVKWATCNLGASKPEEYGGYYAWCETEEKEEYYGSNYFFYDKLGKLKCYVDSVDVAHMKLGGNWRMPTLVEWNELHSRCEWEWTTINGVNGYKVTSKKNGNSIFLPAAGCRYGTEVVLRGEVGAYWSSWSEYNHVWYIHIENSSHDYDRCAPYSGRSIRPINSSGRCIISF